MISPEMVNPLIYMINITPELGGEEIIREKIEKDPRVTLLNNSQVKGVFGDKFVKGIKVDIEGKEREIPVQGVFVEIGLIPNSEFVKDVEKNDKGEIKVSPYNETNLSGVFAAGDVTDVPEKQIIIAAGEGAKAVLGAFKYLARKR